MDGRGLMAINVALGGTSSSVLINSANKLIYSTFQCRKKWPKTIEPILGCANAVRLYDAKTRID